MKAFVQKTLAHLAHHHKDGSSSRAVMELDPAGDIVLLRGTQHLQLDEARGWTVRALGGTAWLTQEGDIRDVVLEAGETIVLDRGGRALLSAMGEARLCIAKASGACTAQEKVKRAPRAAATPHPAYA